MNNFNVMIQLILKNEEQEDIYEDNNITYSQIST